MDFKEKLNEMRRMLVTDRQFSAKFFAEPEKTAEEYMGITLDEEQRKAVLTVKVLEGLNEIQRTIDSIRDDIMTQFIE